MGPLTHKRQTVTRTDYRETSRRRRKQARRIAQQLLASDRHSVSLASFYSRDTVESLARESLPSDALKQALRAGWL
jgi:hypothetical protein